MALETGTYLSDLVPTNPTGADPKSQGDDHVRLLKATLKNSFPLIAGPVPIAHDQIASKDYCNQLAFNTVLPAQPGGTTNYALISNGGAASWKVADIYTDATRLAQAAALALCF